MATRTTPEQRTLLKDLNAACKYVWTSSQSAPLTPGGLPAPGKAKVGEECGCVMIDLYTNKPMLAAYGPTEQIAFDRALEKAKTTDKPMTPAETATKMAELQKELAEANAKLADKVTPEAPKRVTAGELVKQMKAKEISVPLGNHKSQLWRDQARQLLADAKEAAA